VDLSKKAIKSCEGVGNYNFVGPLLFTEGLSITFETIIRIPKF
jgi:hypothetical protein